MDKIIDIYKAAGIIIRDRKFLVTRSKGKNVFVSPGGKLKPQETAKEALIRELEEELTIRIRSEDIRIFGTFHAPAAEQEDKWLRMDVFLVEGWRGEIKSGTEIEEILWIDSFISERIKLGSVFQHEVLPRLKQANLID